MISGAHARRMDAAFAVREFDSSLLNDLPALVDPCGEKQQFFTVFRMTALQERKPGLQQGSKWLSDSGCHSQPVLVSFAIILDVIPEGNLRLFLLFQVLYTQSVKPR